MKKITSFMAISILAFSHTAFSVEDVIPGPGLSKNISQIVSRDSGYHAIFLVSTTFTNTDSCDLNDRGVLNENEAPGNKTMYATAAAAFLAGIPVQLATNGCINTNGGGATTTSPKITKIKLVAPTP